MKTKTVEFKLFFSNHDQLHMENHKPVKNVVCLRLTPAIKLENR